jgi:hypothetical protein
MDWYKRMELCDNTFAKAKNEPRFSIAELLGVDEKRGENIKDFIFEHFKDLDSYTQVIENTLKSAPIKTINELVLASWSLGKLQGAMHRKIVV